MKITAYTQRGSDSIRLDGYPEEWTCAFVDNEGHLRCTTTIDAHSLYVECFELEGERSVDELESMAAALAQSEE